MPSSDRVSPVRMQRVAVVAPRDDLRATLVQVADAGVVELETVATPDALPGPATQALQRLGGSVDASCLADAAPDLQRLEEAGRVDLVAGEAALEMVGPSVVSSREAAALAGWAPRDAVPALAQRLAQVGGAVVSLPRPAGSQPPTLLRRRRGTPAFTTLVETYATVPYSNVDPTVFAGVAYVVMFGLMFGDVGDGLLLMLLALLARIGRPDVLRPLRPAAPLIAAAGASATVAGFLYGEFFGPTGVVPTLWMNPLDDPVRLLLVSLGIGALLLAVAYGIAIVNRVREGGWGYALYAPAGIAGATLFLGLGLLVAGWAAATAWLVVLAVLVSVTGLVLSFLGLYAAAGRGGAAVGQAAVELVDSVLRLGANIVSFGRLAAFGLTHAAISALVWAATTGLWGGGVAASLAAVVVFLLGSAVAFVLEALVAAVQALRLEYYELFSRVFVDEGRPFRPWHLRVITTPDELALAGPSTEEVT